MEQAVGLCVRSSGRGIKDLVGRSIIHAADTQDVDRDHQGSRAIIADNVFCDAEALVRISHVAEAAIIARHAGGHHRILRSRGGG